MIKLCVVVASFLQALATSFDVIAAAPAATPNAQAAPSTAQAPSGPRKRISVAKFDANGAFVAVYGGWEIGGGLAAQLTTALIDSGRFIVVERPDLGVVLREQELAQLNVTSKGSGPQAGNVLGTQLIVRGSVTEFEQTSGSSGMHIGVSGAGGSALNALGGALATRGTKGVVGIDVRVIDASTSQVLQSKHIEKRLSSSETSVELVANQATMGGEQFNKSVLGQATREAIDEAVAFITDTLATLPWTGNIADVDNSRVFINAGGDAGIRLDDRFAVIVVERELTDPSTGQKLGSVESQSGTVRIVAIQPGFSTAVMETPFDAKRGDRVRYIGH